MLYALILLAVVAVALALLRVRRRDVVDEVDRFRHARTLTTTWSSEGQTRGHVPGQEPVGDE